MYSPFASKCKPGFAKFLNNDETAVKCSYILAILIMVHSRIENQDSLLPLAILAISLKDRALLAQ